MLIIRHTHEILSLVESDTIPCTHLGQMLQQITLLLDGCNNNLALMLAHPFPPNVQHHLPSMPQHQENTENLVAEPKKHWPTCATAGHITQACLCSLCRLM